ncbi:MAG: hypothetical protein RLZZ301_424 [Bacteroidota bacterium]|jgi:muramoyltetrapeptide carboxypeptidase
MNALAPLQEGDLVYLCAPAKAIEEPYIIAAENWLQSIGLRALRSPHLLGRAHYFSGTILERLSDLQEGLDHAEVKAIWCVRGGYGSVQLVDGLQWASFLKEPKWIIGFSDICVLHHRAQALGLPSIHATMALNLEKNTAAAKETLAALLLGKEIRYQSAIMPENKLGRATGTLIGGNLSIIYSLLGTPDAYNFSGAILVIEDLAEHLYHIDRMLHALRKQGALEKINGLIVGGMTDLEDTDIPFGLTLPELILSHFTYKNIPICFDFPSGHIDDNQALLFGAEVELRVEENQVSLTYIK